MKGKHWLVVEFVILFFGIPALIYLDQDFIRPSIIILPALVFIFLLLRRSSDFKWKELIRWQVSRKILYGNLVIIGICAMLMLGYVYFFERKNLFNLPRANIWIYLALCLFYPVFSAFGQEIIYRTFLSRRYSRFFTKGWHFILASAFTFSFMHIVYYDPVSMILTFIGGLYFAWNYQLTRSVLFTSVLHGIFGIMIFGVGMGQYFWLDMPV
ncbi:MAG: CPBP family intramembrane glutamic endopeptidase [Bacteroidota bacterium]|nr:CPBP family intramembrane glutamic endopeptidase [Bacteroidota bacterium]